jgi:hypothetical protein
MTDLEIVSSGAPPVRHSDRITSAWLRTLAEEHAALWALIHGITRDPITKDGHPRAQRKLELKVQAAGADYTSLESGKRGKYKLAAYAFSGWDPDRDKRITVDDVPPAKPWLCYWCYMVEGVGRGGLKLYGRGALYLTHHSLSRVCQRWRVRTLDDLRKVIRTIALCCLNYTNYLDEHNSWDHIGPDGARVSLPSGNATIVLKPHEKHDRALVVTTILPAKKHRQEIL